MGRKSYKRVRTSVESKLYISGVAIYYYSHQSSKNSIFKEFNFCFIIFYCYKYFINKYFISIL